MKTKIVIILLMIVLIGCGENRIETKQTKSGGEIIEKEGIFFKVTTLDEFTYKGHVYVSCKVRDGVSLTHAGHCWCNKNK
jgi:hypothetical protein